MADDIFEKLMKILKKEEKCFLLDRQTGQVLVISKFEENLPKAESDQHLLEEVNKEIAWFREKEAEKNLDQRLVEKSQKKTEKFEKSENLDKIKDDQEEEKFYFEPVE